METVYKPSTDLSQKADEFDFEDETYGIEDSDWDSLQEYMESF